MVIDMVDEKLREYLVDIGLEDAVLLESYDKSIIGVTSDDRVAYSYEKIVDELMEDYGWDYDETVDFVEYNTIRSLPYIESSVRPVIIYEIDREVIGCGD